MTPHNPIIVRRFGIAARRNVPLFREIVRNRRYAAALVRAVQARDFDEVETLIRRVVPRAAVSAGAGFESSLIFTNPSQQFGFGIFRPGRAVRTPAVRRVARIMLPIIARLGASRAFRLRVLRLIRFGRDAELLRLLRLVSGSREIESVLFDDFGFYAVVRLPSGARYNAIFSLQV